MSTRFRPYHPEQTYLLPPSPSDCLAEGHMAYFMAEIVDRLDVQSFYARYEGDGRRNHPMIPGCCCRCWCTPTRAGCSVHGRLPRSWKKMWRFAF